MTNVFWIIVNWLLWSGIKSFCFTDFRSRDFGSRETGFFGVLVLWSNEEHCKRDWVTHNDIVIWTVKSSISMSRNKVVGTGNLRFHRISLYNHLFVFLISLTYLFQFATGKTVFNMHACLCYIYRYGRLCIIQTFTNIMDLFTNFSIMSVFRPLNDLQKRALFKKLSRKIIPSFYPSSHRSVFHE